MKQNVGRRGIPRLRVSTLTRKAISAVLALQMLVSAMPAASYAAEGTSGIPARTPETVDYTLYLSNGLHKNSAEGEEVTVSGITYNGSNGYTFDNVDFTSTAQTAIYINKPAVISLKGDNVLTSAYTGGSASETLHIAAASYLGAADTSASLTVEGANNQNGNSSAIAMESYTGTLTVQKGVTLTAEGGTAPSGSASYGIQTSAFTQPQLHIYGHVTASGADKNGVGIYAESKGALSLYPGGMLTASGGETAISNTQSPYLNDFVSKGYSISGSVNTDGSINTVISGEVRDWSQYKYLSMRIFSDDELHKHDMSVSCGSTNPHNFEAWDGTALNKLPIQSEYYLYLTKDVTQSGQFVVPAASTVNLCLNGHVLRQEGTTAPVIMLGNGATLNLCDCNGDNLTHRFTVSDTGLWVLDEEHGTEELTGGVITGGNNTYSGGGVSIGKNYAGGTFHMYGGNIAGNTTSSSGGGVCVLGGTSFNANNIGTFHMYGGTIAGNTALRGGGVCAVTDDDVLSYAYFTMSGNASVRDNAATGSSYGGGGVYISGPSLVAGTKGGMYFAMNDQASITGNHTAGNGGGVDIGGGDCYFIMSGQASITGNSAAKNGGGVYCKASPTLSGAVRITDNTAGGAANNVYVTGESTAMHFGTDGLTEGAEIGVTSAVQLSSSKRDTTVAEAYESRDLSGFFTSDNENYVIKRDERDNTIRLAIIESPPVITTKSLPDGKVNERYELELTATGETPITWTVKCATISDLRIPSNPGNLLLSSQLPQDSVGTHTVIITAKNIYGSAEKELTLTVVDPAASQHTHDISINCSTEGSNLKTFRPLTSVNGVLYIDGVQQTLSDGKYYDLPTGSYYLAEDVTLNRTLRVKSPSVNLCLNGKVLCASGCRAITVGEDPYASLTILDCGKDAEHRFTPTTDSSDLDLWVLDEVNGTETVSGGVITGGILNETSSASEKGAGILLTSGSVELLGGSIAGNEAKNHGGGVCVSGSESPCIFTVTSGSILGNRAQLNGGGVYVEGGTFITGPYSVIANNTCSRGGGLFAGNGTAELSSGIIRENAATYGGGIYILNP